MASSGGTACACDPGYVGQAPDHCDRPFASVASSQSHSCGIRADGTVWCWGANSNGELGDGTTFGRATAIQVGHDTDWAQVSIGGAHTCAVKTGGALWCWGANGSGQIGDGTTSDRGVPARVGTVSTWVAVSAGASHTCAVQSDHSLWCWGSNTHGEGGRLAGGETVLPVEVGTSTTWASVAAGSAFTCGIQTDGSLWCWGSNSSGQLGDGTNSDHGAPAQVGASLGWASVATNSDAASACARKTDGTLWCWGDNASGQLGLGDTSPRGAPTQVGADADWSGIGVAGDHACAVKAGGTLWCWGDNGAGQFGNGSTLTSTTPVQGGLPGTTWAATAAGTLYTCGLRSDQTVACWGDGQAGQLGAGAGDTRHTSPVQLNNSPCSNPQACAAQAACVGDVGTFTCACDPGYSGNGATSCADVDECALGTATCAPGATCGNTPGGYTCSCNAGLVGDGFRCDVPATALAAAWYTSCAIHQDGTLWCWGFNGSSQVGDGSTADRYIEVQVGRDADWAQVSIGGAHVCAVKTGGTLWCWGANGSAQLGLGDASNRILPTQVGTLTTWVQVAAGASHTCAIQSDTSLWCWGSNGNGEAGAPPTSPLLLPHPVRFNFSSLGTGWQSVMAGQAFTCAIQTSGSLWCWGANANGQLGQGDTNDRGVLSQVGTATWLEVAGFASSVCGRQSDGTLWCWGANYDGQLGLGGTGDRSTPAQVGLDTDWASVRIGSTHACALKAGGSLWCWGSDSSGQLGDGTEGLPRTVPGPVLPAGPVWTAVALGDSHTCGQRADGSVWCWGTNANGEIGAPSSDPGQLLPDLVRGSGCGTGHDPCTALARCVDLGSTFSCTCDPGYTGDGVASCADIDECASGLAGCAATATCSNTAGSYTCTCNAGTVGDGAQCEVATTALALGAAAACAIHQDGTLWCWGANDGGQLGDGTTTQRDVPTQEVTGATTWTAASEGDSSACGIQSDGSLWCWGANANGQLGLNDTAPRTSPTRVTSPSTSTQWLAVANGYAHTCGIQSDHTLWCWGHNADGQLGSGAASADVLQPATVHTAPSGPNLWLAVIAGHDHTCAIQSDHTLWCWGYNGSGQLGDGSTTERWSPTQVGASNTWVAAAAGPDASSTCGTRSDGSLWCWGLNSSGQLGDGTTTSRTSPKRVSQSVTWTNGSISGSDACGVRADGTLWCWGANGSGQLGDGSTLNSLYVSQSALPTTDWAFVAVGESFACGVRTNQTVWCWGDGAAGQLGTGPSDTAHALAREVFGP